MCLWAGRKYFAWYGKLGILLRTSEVISLPLHKKYFVNAYYLLDTVLGPGAEQ